MSDKDYTFYIKNKCLKTAFLNNQLEKQAFRNGCDGSITLESGSGSVNQSSAYDALVLGATITDVTELETALETSACPDVTVPGAPTGVVAIAGNASAVVSFTAPADDGGAVITGYTVTASPGGATVSGLSSPLTVSGLTNGVSYVFTVVATNSAGTGPSSITSASVVPATVPSAPTGLIATAGNTTATISFTPGNTGGSPITNYEYSTNGTTWIEFSPADTISPVTINGLTNGITYTIYLRAVNNIGSGNTSSGVSVTPFSISPPGTPTLTRTFVSNGEVYVYVTPGTGITTNYAYTLDGGDTVIELDPVDATSPILIPNLTNNISYTIQLRGINSAGTSAFSNSLTATPSITSTPTAWLYYDPNNSGSYSGSGTSVNNIGSYGAMSGTIGGTLSWITGTNISRKVFNMTGGNIQFGNLNFGNAFTISAWIRPSSKYSINAIITNGLPNVNTAGFKFGWHSWQSENKRLLFENGSGNTGEWNVPTSADNTIVYQEWQHVACIFDRIGRTVLFMRNGIPVSTYDITTAPNVDVNNPTFYIGSYVGGSFSMNAELGMLKVYNSVLTAYQVAEDFNANRAEFGI
jgi:hypothetical protein